MRERLSTGLGAKRDESVLSGPIFSGPHDCADLVNSLQLSEISRFSDAPPEHFDVSGVREKGTRIEHSTGGS